MIDTPRHESPGSAADTLPKLLAANAARFPDAVALREKEFGIWQEITWATYLARVRAFSLGLLDLGLQRGACVAVVGDNRPEWVIAEIATQTVGGLSVGVYQDSVADEVQHILGHSTPVMTQRYAHLQPGHLKAAMNKLDAALKGSATSSATRPVSASVIPSPTPPK